MTALLATIRETNDETVLQPGPGASDSDDSAPRLHAVREGLAALIEERRAEIAAAQGVEALTDGDKI